MLLSSTFVLPISFIADNSFRVRLTAVGKVLNLDSTHY